MHIEFVEIQNFRKLKSIRIDFAPQTTLFVGANNSGKTSAMEALRCFLDHQRFTTNDFTLSNWTRINEIGTNWEAQENRQGSPNISLADWETLLPCLDLWINVEADEIHHVKDVLPTLEWEVGHLGVRLRFEPKKIDELYKDFLAAIHQIRRCQDGSDADWLSSAVTRPVARNDARSFGSATRAPLCTPHLHSGPEQGGSAS